LEHRNSAVDEMVDQIADKHRELIMLYRTDPLLPLIPIKQRAGAHRHLRILGVCFKVMGFNISSPFVVESRPFSPERAL
jgi:hypothetical protein